jgi:glycosyltransferase involved in cell wall biosynthesis
MNPEVSVVMAVFNQERFVAEAVDSVLKQSFTDFELIIIDDGSTDTTTEILDGYDDPRIVRHRNDDNLGLTRSLNRGLRVARGDFIARQDADDISLPLRLEKQIAFLRDRSDVGLVGCACVRIDREGKERGFYRPRSSDIQIRWVSLLTNPFAHPTVFFRSRLLTEHGLHYDESLETTQDYDLWLRMLERARGANISEALMLYRKGGDITTAKRRLQLATQDAIAFRAINNQFPELALTPKTVSRLRSLFVGGDDPPPLGERVRLAGIYLDLFEAFLDAHREASASELKELKRVEALKVARTTLRAAARPGWTALAKRLFSFDPNVAWSLAGYVFTTFGRRLASFIPRKSV